MSGFTPGPWIALSRLSGSENHKGFYIKCRRFVVADVIPVDQDGIEGRANARLIAAAPELLEALRSIVHYHDLINAGHDHWDDAYAEMHLESVLPEARAAIAKATGKQL